MRETQNMRSMKTWLIYAFAAIARVWTWHVLRRARCGECRAIAKRKDLASMGGRCPKCYTELLFEWIDREKAGHFS
jgi:predicted Zn-ribbon and HTH transcriptional regulator